MLYRQQAIGMGVNPIQLLLCGFNADKDPFNR
jgi:hypothetical protein